MTSLEIQLCQALESAWRCLRASEPIEPLQTSLMNHDVAIHDAEQALDAAGWEWQVKPRTPYDMTDGDREPLVDAPEDQAEEETP